MVCQLFGEILAFLSIFIFHDDKTRERSIIILNIHGYTIPLRGSGSVVGIATAYGDRIPVGARFSAPVQTGPEAHPASCKMGTGSFSGASCGRGVTLTPQPLLVLTSKIE